MYHQSPTDPLVSNTLERARKNLERAAEAAAEVERIFQKRG